MGTVLPLKLVREAPKTERNSMETVFISIKEVNTWRLPPFQRPLRVNEKVRALAEELKQGECALPGILTLGNLRNDRGAPYIVDGQHRVEAFKISGLSEIIADIRSMSFDTLAEMAEEFGRLNEAIVRMRPDDVLRALECSLPALQMLCKRCDFIGYDNIRRRPDSPVLGMSQTLRCWRMSAGESPASGSSSGSAAQLALALDMNEAEHLAVFLLTARSAWGRDQENYRLWSTLNLTMCMWLWRRLVLDTNRGLKRAVVLTPSQFQKCLLSVSASESYSDWLVGRKLNDRDRSPCFARLRDIFVKRLIEQGEKKPLMPRPAWVS